MSKKNEQKLSLFQRIKAFFGFSEEMKKRLGRKTKDKQPVEVDTRSDREKEKAMMKQMAFMTDDERLEKAEHLQSVLNNRVPVRNSKPKAAKEQPKPTAQGISETF